jgi:hypothetical protein
VIRGSEGRNPACRRPPLNGLAIPGGFISICCVCEFLLNFFTSYITALTYTLVIGPVNMRDSPPGSFVLSPGQPYAGMKVTRTEHDKKDD